METSEAERRAERQRVCDLLKVALIDMRENVKSQMAPLASTLAQLESMSKMAVQPQKDLAPKQRVDQLLPDYVREMLEKKNQPKKDNDLASALAMMNGQQQQQPRGIEKPDEKNNVLDQPIPPAMPPEPPQNQSQFPWWMMNNNMFGNNSANNAKINLNLPNGAGSRLDLMDAQDQVSNNDMRTSALASLGARPTLPQLANAKALVTNDLQNTQSAYDNANSKAKELDAQLAELKQGARDALDEPTKEKLDGLKNDYDQKKASFDNIRQMMMFSGMGGMMGMGGMAATGMGGGSGGMDPQTQNMMMMAMVSMNQAKTEYDKFNTAVDRKIESGNKELKGLATLRDQLASTANQLKRQIGTLKSEQTTVASLVDQQMQSQLAAMTPGNMALNIKNFGGTPTSSRPTTRPSAQAPSGGTVRGPFGF